MQMKKISLLPSQLLKRFPTPLKTKQWTASLVISFTAVTVLIILGRTAQQRALGVTTALLLSDIRSQQQLSLSGALVGAHSVVPYGIKFNSDGYALFQGYRYPSLQPELARQVSLPAGVTLETSLPNDELIFESGSGNVYFFSQVGNTITIKDTRTNLQTTLRLNRYGVVSFVR